MNLKEVTNATECRELKWADVYSLLKCADVNSLLKCAVNSLIDGHW